MIDSFPIPVARRRPINIGYFFGMNHPAQDGPVPVAFEVGSKGQYRIQNTSAEGFLLYVGVNGPPDFDQPAASFSSTLPLTLNWPLPGTGIVTLHVVARYRDSWGCISQNRHATLIKLSPSGQVLLPLPTPLQVVAYPRPSTSIGMRASYPTRTFEPDPADKLKVWVSASGPPDINVGATNTTNITNDNIVTEFGTYSPGTYYVAVAFYRTVDQALSAAVYTTVEFPPLPGNPEAVFTDNVTL